MHTENVRYVVEALQITKIVVYKIEDMDIQQHILYWYPACFKMQIRCGYTSELPIKCCIPLLNVRSSPA